MNPYDLDQTKEELTEKEAIFNASLDVQVVLQILIDKEICTREEIQQHRERVKQLPKFKATANYLEQAKNSVAYYKSNPEQHLRDILKAKMEGTIK